MFADASSLAAAKFRRQRQQEQQQLHHLQDAEEDVPLFEGEKCDQEAEKVGSWTYRSVGVASNDGERGEAVVRRREESRRRWKILCLVRSSNSGKSEDLADDEEVRRERIKDKVDEWMGSFVARMRRMALEESSNVGRGVNLAVPNGEINALPPIVASASRSRLQVIVLKLTVIITNYPLMKEYRARESRRLLEEQAARMRARELEERARMRKRKMSAKERSSKV